ncbi:MAG: hypothetical protein VW397_00720 [Candidatus Margulisiibacteriota bacterium]
MSDIGKISSEQPSLIEEIINAPDTISNNINQSIQSSNSPDELYDKLDILEKVSTSQIDIQKIQLIKNQINDGESIQSIKHKLAIN